jgi:acetylornithine/succinyldiaminopimelate/putrescine aminotransferase
MVGIELTVDGTDIVKKCIEKRLLVNCTHQTVIRLLPAMNLREDEFNEGMTILESALLAS